HQTPSQPQPYQPHGSAGSWSLPRGTAAPFASSTTWICCARWKHLPGLPGHPPSIRTLVTTYENRPLVNTCAAVPSMSSVGTAAVSAVSSALAIGSMRTCEVLVSLPHQSDEISATRSPLGCAVTTLR